MISDIYNTCVCEIYPKWLEPCLLRLFSHFLNYKQGRYKGGFTFLIFAVICTFSFGSAFAAVSYAPQAALGKVITDTTDYTDFESVHKYSNGSYGISEVERAEYVSLLTAASFKAYAAPAAKALKEANAIALEAVKAAKTNKEMMLAIEAYQDVVDDNAGYTYASLSDSWTALNVGSVTFNLAIGHYMSPDYGLIDNVDNSTYSYNYIINPNTIADLSTAAVTVDGQDTAAFESLMDLGVYGYLSGDAWKAAAKSKSTKAAFTSYWDEYYLGTILVEDVDNTDSTNYTNMYKALSTYGQQLYVEYLATVAAVKAYNKAGVPTFDSTVEVLKSVAAFNDKYFDGETIVFSIGTPAAEDTGLVVNYALVSLAAENWNLANLDAQVTAISNINTANGYLAAKADILALAKKLMETFDTYYDFYKAFGNKFVAPTVTGYSSVETKATGLLINSDDINTVLTALGKILQTTKPGDGYEVQHANVNTFTNKVSSAFAADGTGVKFDFDDRTENLAALEAARKAFDAYVADYAFLYDFCLQNGFGVANVLSVPTLVSYETKLLSAEYNKTQTATYEDKQDVVDNSIVKTYLNNATVTVKSTKLAAKKVRVQAKVDTTTLKLIVDQLGAGSTVEYKFYHKAPGKSFKLTKTKSVNYITYTSKSLKAGKNCFRVGLVVKDKDGKVVATKDYQASSLAYRTIK